MQIAFHLCHIHAAIVKPEFSIRMASGVSLLCSVSSQWVISSTTNYWWRKVLLSRIIY